MSKFKALLIPFDDTKPVEVVEINGRDDIYQHVAPESRRFTVQRSKTFDLLGDEEGLFQGNPTERINARAMEIYASDWGLTLKDFLSPLVGDWLACGGADFNGNMTDVPQSVIDFQFSWTTSG